MAENHVAKEASKFRRLELIVFSGEDPMGWVSKVERYFSVTASESSRNWPHW